MNSPSPGLTRALQPEKNILMWMKNRLRKFTKAGQLVMDSCSVTFTTLRLSYNYQNDADFLEAKRIGSGMVSLWRRGGVVCKALIKRRGAPTS